MRVGSKKEGKQYKGIREGGISENTAYYVFTHAAVTPSKLHYK
jgi:transcription initiation factor TFIIF subunit alpha